MTNINENPDLEKRRKNFEEALVVEQQRLEKLENKRPSTKAMQGIGKTPLDIALEEKEASMGKIGQSIKVSSEFFSAIFVGIALGYASDHFLGTSPWGIIVFLILGFCAAVLNLLRYTNISQKNKQ